MTETQLSEQYGESLLSNAAADEAMQQAVETEDASAEKTSLSLIHQLEALLFVACEPLSIQELAQFTDAEQGAVIAALDELEAHYAHRGMVLRRVAGGFQFVTPEACLPLIEKLYRPKYQQLSAAALEALSVIAYKQPVTRSEISAIRQVDSDSVINTLLEKNLIHEVGRVDGAGRAVLYGTGQEFLTFFGLDSLDDLPPLGAGEDTEGGLTL